MRSISPHAAAVSARRRLLVVQVLPLLQQGLSANEACRQLGIAPAALSRALKPAGDDGTPAERALRLLSQPLAQLAPPKPRGRQSDFLTLTADPVAQTELRSLYAASMRASSEAMTHGRYTGSMSVALQRLGDHLGMPEPLAARLRAGEQPACLRRFLKQITPEIEQLIRGPKHYQLHGPTAQKDNTLRLPDGRRARQLAGHRIVMDDMSVNQPFFADIHENGQIVDTILSRQGLYALDEASWRWLGVELIARPREAYRAEDILRFIHRLVQVFGKFDCLVLEQGVWKSRVIRGFGKSPNGDLYEVEIERPAMPDAERANLTRGLEAIGIQIVYVTGAHAKTIENAFGYLQRVIATFTRDFQNIGAHAGEFERAAKQLRRARAGSHHPSDLKFAPIDTLADRIESAMTWVNAHPKDALQGRAPDQVWAADMQLRTLPPLAEWERVAFLPDLRERSLRGGAIHFNRHLLGHPFSFRHGQWMADLGEGYRVYVRFDACDPAAGAAILNREPAANPRNRWQFAEGQFICWAPFELPAPRMDVETLPSGHVAVDDYYGIPDDTRDRELRRQIAWHKTVGRILPRPGQPAVRASSIRDGRGNVATTSPVNPVNPVNPVPPSPRSSVDRSAIIDDMLQTQDDCIAVPPARDRASILDEIAAFSAEPF